MAAYNRDKVIEESICSIQNQTFQDWELIICDDGSTDQTREICRTFEERDQRIKVLENGRNMGVGATRNRLLQYASGKYIAIQDSDDFSVPGRLAWEVELLESNPGVGLVSGVEAWTNFDENRVMWHFPPYLYNGEQYPQDRMVMVERLYVNGGVSHAACMFRHSLVENTHNPYGSYRVNEDWFLFIHLAHRTLTWGIPEVLVRLRRGRNHRHLMSEYVWALNEAETMKWEIYQFYKNDPESPINYWLYRRSIAPLHLWKGKYLGGFSGYLEVLKALFWNPLYSEGWKSFGEFSARALGKSRRLFVSGK